MIVFIMLYLIGLGLNEKGISLEGLEIIKKSDKVYLEGYTVDFPYSVEKLEKLFNKKIEVLDRSKVESDKIVSESKRKDIALLIYGSPLVATTHISLIQEAIDSKVDYNVINSASIFDAIAESGLQLYKFGKVASMPAWNEEKNYKPDSFIKLVEDNQKIEAHSLILCDIGLKFQNALEQLRKSAENHNFSLENKKIVVCQSLGTENQKFYHGGLENLRKKGGAENGVENPFCLIIPGKLHFSEEEFLNNFDI